MRGPAQKASQRDRLLRIVFLGGKPSSPWHYWAGTDVLLGSERGPNRQYFCWCSADSPSSSIPVVDSEQGTFAQSPKDVRCPIPSEVAQLWETTVQQPGRNRFPYPSTVTSVLDKAVSGTLTPDVTRISSAAQKEDFSVAVSTISLAKQRQPATAEDGALYT